MATWNKRGCQLTLASNENKLQVSKIAQMHTKKKARKVEKQHYHVNRARMVK